MPHCDRCPQASCNVQRNSQKPNSYAVLEDDGSISYTYRNAQRQELRVKMLWCAVVAKYPELAERIEGCDGPLVLDEPVNNLLGRIGLIKSVVAICMPLDFDPTDLDGVEKYFME